jgi:outer membrane lipoprotein LolB
MLGGCATVAPPRAADEIAGRIAIRVDATASAPARSFSADFDLRGTADAGQLRLTGPLGATLADVRWSPAGASLTDASGSREAPTLDALAQALVGEPLPLAALTDWLRGRPWAGAPSVRTADGFDQLGWHIGLAGQRDGLLTARRAGPPAVDVRARLEPQP